MQASILEIYNETIRDLLSNRPCGIDQTDNSVPDLTIVDVCSVNEVSSLLKQAAQCRFVGRTQMNEQSSRSHFVLTLRICGINEVDSVEKLDKLLAACKALGVETQPMVIGELGIIPLFSWYHESFDREKDITGFHIPPLEMACKDFHACKWPQGLSNGDMSLSMYFDAINDKQLEMMEEVKMKCDHIITFSHFVPRQELCPEKRMLFYPKLPKIIGSDSLEDRIRSIHGAEGRKDSSSACHVFGHTHFCWDAVVDGIRYVQAPLAYPRERKRRMNGGENWLPFCIYAENKFSERLNPCFWSDYYSANPRTPHNTELAPWVARFYRQTHTHTL